MKKGKFIGLLFLITFIFSGCAAYQYNPNFAPQSIIANVEAHRVVIAVYYEMSENEYLRRMEQKTDYWRKWSIFQNQEDSKIYPYDLEIGPILISRNQDSQNVTVAYLGAGAILKDNHVLSVNHLFSAEHQANALAMYVWVLKEGVDHPIKAYLVARSENEISKVVYDDYAVIKMEEELGLPGLKISTQDLKDGDKVMFTGSPGGLAFFTRFGFITRLQNYFRKDAQGILHLSFFQDFPYWTVYPGGPGDSGGFVANMNGEIATVMYLGLTVHSENYTFCNPVKFLWDFLKKHNLEHLGK